MNQQVINEVRRLFGNAFRDLRKEKGLAQKTVADFCGISQATLNKIEQGSFAYSFDHFVKLSVILKFTINIEQKEEGIPDRFLLQKSERRGHYVVTDEVNQITCIFEVGKFDDTQKFTFLNNNQCQNLPTILRELGDWLFENHPDKI